MAKEKQDILSKLADKGEGALSRVASSQTTALVVGSVTGLRERMMHSSRNFFGSKTVGQAIAAATGEHNVGP